MGATTWDETPSPSLNEISGKVLVAVITILVMVILFVLLVHIYARWFWSRHGGAEIHRLRRSRSHLVFAPTQEPFHRGLEPSILHALPIVIFKQEDFKEGLECAVCLCELEDGEKARLLPNCNHGFHIDCIDMWFQSHSTCPLCRITVGAESTGLSSPATQTEDANSGSVSAENNGAEEMPATSSAPQSPTSSMYANRASSLIIDIPNRLMNGLSSRSPSASSAEEAMKSPMSTGFRSLTGLLSRERMVNPSCPSYVDVEQGKGGRAQFSDLIGSDGSRNLTQRGQM